MHMLFHVHVCTHIVVVLSSSSSSSSSLQFTGQEPAALPTEVKVHSANSTHRGDINSGDKIILSPAVLVACEQNQLSYPVVRDGDQPSPSLLPPPSSLLPPPSSLLPPPSFLPVPLSLSSPELFLLCSHPHCTIHVPCTIHVLQTSGPDTCT